MTHRNLTLQEKLLLPNGPERLAEEGDHKKEVLDLVSGISFTENTSAALATAGLAYLIRIAKQKEPREWIGKHLTDALLERWLTAPVPKVRKNAARLIGQLERTSLDQAVIQALEEEQTRLVRPSMILTLGALHTKPAFVCLRSLTPPVASDSSEEKHCQEEAEALRKALASFVSEGVHRFTDFPARPGFTVELRCGKGFEEGLRDEVLRNKAGKVLKVRPGCVLVEGITRKALMTLRSYRELLIPFSSVSAELTDQELEALAKKTAAQMKEMHRGEPPYRFRLETGKREGTAGLAARIEGLSKGILQNTPGHYECEIRMRTGGKPSERVRTSIKLYTLPDERFGYRKAAVAASIHPANAAGLMELARPWLKKGASVLDPCCGSGTLLAERAMVNGRAPARLIGIDLAADAMDAAKKNLQGFAAATCPVTLIHRDLRAAALKEPVDELFANLPFGNRVGTHAYNEDLYRILMEKLPEWLKPGGIAVLYTMEGTLLLNEAKRIPQLTLLKTKRVEAGGLEPTVAIFRREEESGKIS